MNKNIVGLIVVLVLSLVLAVVCYVTYRTIRRKIRRFLGGDISMRMIQEGMGMLQQEYNSTPKSVSGATSLCLPRITRDFPDFHYEEMKERAENVLISYLRSIDALNHAFLTEGTAELRSKLQMQIDSMRSSGSRKNYKEIRVHRTEISRYNKTSAKCGVTFQSAVEYLYSEDADGKITRGSKEVKTQSKYDVEVIYIQDRELINDTADQALGVNCPNCGAPLSGVGAKRCIYCDTPVVEFNIRTWNFSDVEEIL